MALLNVADEDLVIVQQFLDNRGLPVRPVEYLESQVRDVIVGAMRGEFEQSKRNARLDKLGRATDAELAEIDKILNKEPSPQVDK